MNEIKLYKSRWKAIRLLLLASPFIALAIWDLKYNTSIMPDWVSWSCLGFFGLGIAVSLFNFFDRKPQIIINETGVFDRTAYKDFINWNIIDHAYWNTSFNQPFVCLIIKDEFKHLIQIKSKLKEVSLAMGYSEININLGPISNIEHEKLTALIINLAKADPAARARLINQSDHLPVKQS